MRFRRFNDEGLARFRDYLDRLKHEDPKLDPPPGLLNDDRYSSLLEPAIHAEPQPFARRMDFACWLHDVAKDAGVEIPGADKHFWAWLSLALFDQVCPVNDRGHRTVRELAWYIPMLDDRRRHYRHILYGSYTIFYIYRDKPEIADLLLMNKLPKLGHFWYQIASRQDLVSNPSVIGAATKIYVDTMSMRPKSRSATQAPGAVFRFVKLMNQLDRVWDLRLRGVDGILEVLPPEFSSFIPDDYHEARKIYSR